MPESENWPGKTASSQRRLAEGRSGWVRTIGCGRRKNQSCIGAVERHAAKDPGVRGKLKRASAACHPESESQKKIALVPSVSYAGSSASGTRPCITARTAQDTDGPELAQGEIQPSRSGDTGDDVAMEGENADERDAGHLNPSGPDRRRRITTKREPREARDEQSIAASQRTSRGGCQGRRPRRVMRWLSPRKRHRTGPVGKS